MRAVLTSFGSTGDIQPVLALALMMRARGHEPVMAVSPKFQRRVEQFGLAYIPVGPELRDEDLRAVIAPQMELRTPAEQVGYFIRAVQPHILPMFADLRRACVDADVLIGPPFQIACRMVRDMLEIPWVSLHFSHFGAYGAKDMREATAPTINRCRAQAGLRALHDPLGADSTSPDLALYAISTFLLKAPSRWPSHHRVTGFFFVDEPGWSPEPALQRFIDESPPPVLMTFGSVIHADPDAVTQILIRAVEAAGVRAILQRGWSGLGRIPLPETMLSVGHVPHASLLPRVAGLVHHGGAGSTAAALRAGVPTVVVPHNGDQPIWGQLAHELGCAARPIPYRELTSERLADAIRQVSTQPAFSAASRRLSGRVQAETGTVTACELIEEMVAARLRAVRSSTAAHPWSGHHA